MADLILDVDWNITKAEAKQRKLNRKMEISEQKAENIKKEMSGTADNIQKSTEKIKKLKSQLEEIRKENQNKFLNNTFTKEDSNTYKKKEAELQKENQILAKQNLLYAKQEVSLNKQNRETANIGDQIHLNTKNQNKFSQAFEKSQKSADRFGRRLKSLIASALFFTLVTKAFTALRNEFGKLITETGTKTASLVAQLNGNLTVLGRTLYESAKPYIEWMLEKLVKMVNILTQGLANILGKDVNAMKKLAQATKKTADEAQKATASFDTLQKIDTSSSDHSDIGAGVSYDALNDGIDNEVSLLMAIISSAALVLGVILAFTGANIPLGIGLIAVGAVGLASSISASWGTMTDKTKGEITGIMAIGSALFLLLGLILILTGAGIPLGIGLILLGVSALYGSIALSPGDSFIEKIKNLWENVKSIISNFITWFRGNVLDKIFGTEFGNAIERIFKTVKEFFGNITSFFTNIFSGDIKGALKSLINAMIDLLNLFISITALPGQALIGGISKLAGTIGKLFGKNWEFNTSFANPKLIPHLATGAVIPGGSPFFAMLGDQPKGKTNIEAPLETLIEAFKAAQGSNKFTIEATGNMAQLIRLLNLKIKEENKRATMY